MSHSIRFIGLAIAGWVGVRALSLGVIPGAEAWAFDRPAPPPPASSGTVPALVATDLGPTEALEPAAPVAPDAMAAPGAYPMPVAYRPYPVASGWSGPPSWNAPLVMPTPRRSPVERFQLAALRSPAPGYEEYAERHDDTPLSGIPSASRPQAAIPSPQSSAAPRKFDRLQLTAWAMLRAEPGPQSLAGTGTLGGSQAGARLLYRFNRAIAASFRSTAPIGITARGGGELSAGVRYQPFARIPVAITAERRFGIGPTRGPSSFALFAEGGIYQQPILAGFALDAYLQAGMVGTRQRAAFVDGSGVLTRPLWKNVSGGIGVWGGAQPGLTRLDVGPRVSLKLGRGLKAHADYRYRLVGNARPGSGGVLTVAGDF